MNHYTLAHIQSRYPVDPDSGYAPRTCAADTFLQWQPNRYPTAWDRERSVLSEALIQPEAQSDSLAEQVFGSQTRQQKLQVQHEASLVSARYDLHKKHLRDIQHRLSEVQERLSIARLLNPMGPSKQETDLEKMLLTLESQKREEEVAFWKDTLKVRQEMFTGLREYQAARHRANIFKDLEEGYGHQP